MADNNGVQENVDNLKEDITKLRSDLSGITDTLMKISRNAYSIKNKELHDDALKLIEEFGDTMNTARSMSREKIRMAESKIGEKPFLSVLIAFLIGLVIGTVYDRR